MQHIFSRDSWFFKVYCWSKQVNPIGVNLCPFVRHVFIYAPLKFLFWRGKVLGIRLAIVLWPILLFELPRWAGVLSYDLKEIVYAIYIALAMVATLFGLVWLGVKTSYNYSDSINDIFRKIDNSQTLKLLETYISSIHDSICPWIEFR